MLTDWHKMVLFLLRAAQVSSVLSQANEWLVACGNSCAHGICHKRVVLPRVVCVCVLRVSVSGARALHKLLLALENDNIGQQ
jgi:hypothetical protein